MPVLDRREDEYLIVMPPGELPQTWQEVTDFSSSGPEDRHFVIDSITGVLQFGPLVREPYQLQEETEFTWPGFKHQTLAKRFGQPPSLEQQYSSVPPQQYGEVPRRGSMLRMSRYRTGGGVYWQCPGGKRSQFLNLPSPTLLVLRITSQPAMAPMLNLWKQAAIKVPQLLRTRDRAVTPEDFELLAIRGGSGAVARAPLSTDDGGASWDSANC